jgi:transmembrane sensor
MTNKSILSARRAEDFAIEWLVKLNSSQLSQEQEADFFRWLDSSSSNQNAYIKAEELWQRGGVLSLLKEPEARPRWTLQSWQGFAVACSFILVVAVAAFVNLSLRIDNYSFQTAVGEQKEFELEDGSHIILNTDSRIRLQFARHLRSATIESGEVFFDIETDHQRPFEVSTKFGKVKVLGTRFSVYQSASDAVITVLEGKVAINPSDEGRQGPASAVTLTANQRSSFLSLERGELPEQLNAVAKLAWRQKQLVFRGERLEEVVKDLNRYYSQTIELDGATLNDREVTAVIRLSDLRSTVQALADSLGLRAEYDSSGSTITLASPIEPTVSPQEK